MTALTVAMSIAAAIPFPMTSPRDTQNVGFHLHPVEKISADLKGWKAMSGYVEAGELRMAARQQLCLNIGRAGQLHLKLVTAHLAFAQWFFGYLPFTDIPEYSNISGR
jgi:hypothetical protein